MASNDKRNKVRARIRGIISGTSERPRLSIFKSDKHIYAQLIDDTQGVTIVSESSMGKEIRELTAGKTGVEKSVIVGEKLAHKAIQAGISSVVFDRGGYKYHGKVKALADAARNGGLQF
jgi:large subunit ribosomal protein L18